MRRMYRTANDIFASGTPTEYVAEQPVVNFGRSEWVRSRRRVTNLEEHLVVFSSDILAVTPEAVFACYKASVIASKIKAC